MATVKFLIKGKNNPSTIYVRLRDGRRIDLTVSTLKTINPEYWNKNGVREKSEFKDKLNLTNDLIKLDKLILQRRNETITNQSTLNKDWLLNVISEWRGENVGGESDLLKDLLIDYKKRLPLIIRNGKQGVSNGTLRGYNTTIERLKKFEVYKKVNYKATTVDLNFHSQYLNYAQSNLGLSLNSIGTDIKHFKCVLREFKERGFKINEQSLSRSFSKPSEKTIFTTLTETELNAIKDFEGVNHLENAKDWLIIGCWTGCRVGDLMALTNDNIILHSTGVKFIRYIQSKTGKTVDVPMHPHVKEILEKLNGFPRPISDVKFNKYIKMVCKKVGLMQKIKGSKQNEITHLKEVGYFQKWELVRSHICRRSFASNHYNQLPNKLIMAVTGHATEKMLLNYIGEIDNDHIDSYMEYWTNQQKEKEQSLIENKKIG